MSKQLGRARVKSTINSVLIITKARDNNLIKLTRELALWLMLTPRNGSDRGVIVYVDSQLRNSKRFDAEGLQRDHPDLFSPSTSPSRSSPDAPAPAPTAAASSSSSNTQGGRLRYWTADMCSRSPHLFDFVVTLGGDGTVLFCSWLFQRIVPPVMPFALGSLGFLTNFDFSDYQSVIKSALEQGIRVNLRMRFTATVYRASLPEENTRRDRQRRRAIKSGRTGEIIMRNVREGGWERIERPGGMACGNNDDDGATGGPPKKDREVMCFSTRPVETFEVLNDLVVDRGPSPYVSLLEVFGDEHHMTTAQADGLCISTPTGSTAYSLSAGGSLVHPEIPAILITPICPHTLSFRPMLLPDSMELRIAVPYNSRSTAWASFDGRGRVELRQGDHIKVTASRYPFPTICNQTQSTDWFESISRTLKWNERQRQKSFVVLEEDREPAASGAGAHSVDAAASAGKKAKGRSRTASSNGAAAAAADNSKPASSADSALAEWRRKEEGRINRIKDSDGDAPEMCDIAQDPDAARHMSPAERTERQAVKTSADRGEAVVPSMHDHLSGPAKADAINAADGRKGESGEDEDEDEEEEDSDEEPEEEAFDIDDTSTAATRAPSPQGASAGSQSHDSVLSSSGPSALAMTRRFSSGQGSRGSGTSTPANGSGTGSSSGHHHHHHHHGHGHHHSHSHGHSAPISHRPSFDGLSMLAPFTARDGSRIDFDGDAPLHPHSRASSSNGAINIPARHGSSSRAQNSGGASQQQQHRQLSSSSSLLNSPDRFSAAGPPSPPRAISDRHLASADFRLDDSGTEQQTSSGSGKARGRESGGSASSRTSRGSGGGTASTSTSTSQMSGALQAAEAAVKGAARVLDGSVTPTSSTTPLPPPASTSDAPTSVPEDEGADVQETLRAQRARIKELEEEARVLREEGAAGGGGGKRRGGKGKGRRRASTKGEQAKQQQRRESAGAVGEASGTATETTQSNSSGSGSGGGGTALVVYGEDSSSDSGSDTTGEN